MKYNPKFEPYLEKISIEQNAYCPVSKALAAISVIMPGFADKEIEEKAVITHWLVKAFPLICLLIAVSYLLPFFTVSLPDALLEFLLCVPQIIGLVISILAIIAITPYLRKLRMIREMKPYAELGVDIMNGNAYVAVGRIDPTSPHAPRSRSEKTPHFRLSGYLKPDSAVCVKFCLGDELCRDRIAGLDRANLFGLTGKESGWSDFLLVTNKKTAVLFGYTKDGKCWISLGDWSFFWTRKAEADLEKAGVL